MVIIFIAPYFTAIEGAKAILPIVAFVFVFDSMRQFGFSLIHAFEKMEYDAGIFLLTNASIAILGADFLVFSPSATSFAMAYAVGTGIGMGATLYTLRDKFKNLLAYFSKKLIKSILFSAWPFTFSRMIAGLMISMDIFIIGFFYLQPKSDIIR